MTDEQTKMHVRGGMGRGEQESETTPPAYMHHWVSCSLELPLGFFVLFWLSFP